MTVSVGLAAEMLAQGRASYGSRASLAAAGVDGAQRQQAARLDVRAHSELTSLLRIVDDLQPMTRSSESVLILLGGRGDASV